MRFGRDQGCPLETPDGSVLQELLVGYRNVMLLSRGQQKGDQFAHSFGTHV